MPPEHAPERATSSSSSFMDGIAYSQRGTGKRTSFGSLARRSQELGAELCARLSQTVLEQWTQTPSYLSTALVASPSPSSWFMEDVQRDLSAHYGSHAVRRGLAKPFGPCVHPILRRGNFAAVRAGVHDPVYMRLWEMRRVHRLWCSKCGVWLTRGRMAKSKVQQRQMLPSILSTVQECRARQPRRRRDGRRPFSTVKSSKKFVACCVRCLAREHKAAVRAASVSPAATGVLTASFSKVCHSGKEAKVKKQTIAAQQTYTVKTQKALNTVVRAAKVPRRNRRCKRKSARRPYKNRFRAKEKASVKEKRIGAAGTAVTLSVAQVTQKLAASLVVKPPTAAPAKAHGSPDAAVKETPAARAAQKSLHGLVPTGPLKKLSRSARAPYPVASEVLPTESPANASTKTASVAASASAAPSPKPSTVSARQQQQQPRAKAREQPTPTRPAGAIPPNKAEVTAVLHKAPAAPPPPLSQAPKATAALSSSSAPSPSTKTVPHASKPVSAPGASSPTTAKPDVPGRLPTKVGPAPTPSPSSLAKPPSVNPPGPPAKTVAKKAMRAAAKAPPKASSKSKLLDTMSRLGF